MGVKKLYMCEESYAQLLSVQIVYNFIMWRIIQVNFRNFPRLFHHQVIDQMKNMIFWIYDEIVKVKNKLPYFCKM